MEVTSVCKTHQRRNISNQGSQAWEGMGAIAVVPVSSQESLYFLVIFSFCVKDQLHNEDCSGFPCLGVLLINVRVKSLLYKNKEVTLISSWHGGQGTPFVSYLPLPITANGVSSPQLPSHRLLYSIPSLLSFSSSMLPTAAYRPLPGSRESGRQISHLCLLPAHSWTVEEAPTLSGGGPQYPTHDLIPDSQRAGWPALTWRLSGPWGWVRPKNAPYGMTWLPITGSHRGWQHLWMPNLPGPTPAPKKHTHTPHSPVPRSPHTHREDGNKGNKGC